MRGKYARCVATFPCPLAAGLIFLAAAHARADVTQNQAADGSLAQLTAAGYAAITGFGTSVLQIESGGLANTLGGTVGSSPQSVLQLQNGNPDLPAHGPFGVPFGSVQLFQLANRILPAGGVTATTRAGGRPLPTFMGQLLSVSNHATEVAGVMVGQGVAGPADRGISPIATLYEGEFFGAAPTTNPAGWPSVTNQGLNVAGHPNTANLSFGGNLYNATTGFLVYTTDPAGNITGYGTTAAPTRAMPNPPAPMGTTLALSSNGSRIPVYNTTGPPAAPTDFAANNNGLSGGSKYIAWAATRYNVVAVVAGNEGTGPSAVPGNPGKGTTLGTLTTFLGMPPPQNFGVVPGLPGTGAAAPSDAYNVLNVAATGAILPGNQKVNYDIYSPYNLPNGTSDGRIGVNLVAPGGDPTPVGAVVAVGPMVFNSQFQSTAGGVTTTTTLAGVTRTDAYTGSGVTTFSSSFVYPAVGMPPVPQVATVPIDGTSFAAPLVSGASALLTQNGADNLGGRAGNPEAINHLVIKALLMNGASHVGVDGMPLEYADANGGNMRPWTQAPSTGATIAPPAAFAGFQSYKNGNITNVAPGQFPVQSGLDPALGTGMLNVVQSLNNQSAGEQHSGGNVNASGWDYFTVPNGTPGQTVYVYNFAAAGRSPFAATLDWDDPVTLDAASRGVWSTNSTLTRQPLQNLSLYLFGTNGLGGPLVQNLDFSTSLVDNDQYLYLPNIAAGNYQMDVVVQGATTQDTPYGLAWATAAVPEPGTLALLGAAAAVGWRRLATAA